MIAGLLPLLALGDFEAALQNTLRALRVVPKEHRFARFLVVSCAAGSYAMSGHRNEAFKILTEALEDDLAKGSRNVAGFLTTKAAIEYYCGNIAGVEASAKHIHNPENGYVRSLLNAFEEKISTETAVTPSAEHRSEAGQSADAVLASGLSIRELEVLNLLEGPLSKKEIAERLFVSPETVKKHIYRIYRKLKAHSRLQAVAAAKQRGLLSAKKQY